MSHLVQTKMGYVESLLHRAQLGLLGAVLIVESDFPTTVTDVNSSQLTLSPSKLSRFLNLHSLH